MTKIAGPRITAGPSKARVFAAFFVGSLLLATAIVLVNLGFTQRSLTGVAIVAVLIASYAAFGHQAMVCENERRGGFFLALTVPLACALFLVSPAYLLSLFGFYPLCFTLVDRVRSQLFASIGHSISVAIANASSENFSASAWLTGGLIGLVSLLFSLMMGFWNRGIIKESKNRQTLINELTQTRSELARVQHDAGVRDERQRLSAEIHDTLAQGFGSILLLARGAQSALSVDHEKAQLLLANIEATAQENLHEARALVEHLAPAALQNQSLVDAVSRVSQRTQTESGILITVIVHGSPIALPPADEVVILRAIQESLTNVAKHSQASTASVALHYNTTPIQAIVRDNGQGFVSESPTGFGLSGMRSRLASVGGAVNVKSSPGSGTEVQVSLA
jgi:signal transduction histidine kinase